MARMLQRFYSGPNTKKASLAILLLLWAAGLKAASTATITTAAYPLLLYTPEFSLVLGGGAVIVRRPPGRDPARPDNLTLNAMYTLKNQSALQLVPEIYFKDEKIKLRVEASYKNMPTSFFGVGNSPEIKRTELDNREQKFTNQAIAFRPQLSMKILEELRVGGIFDFSSTKLRDLPPGGSLGSAALTGLDGGVQSGAGFFLELDTRDNLFYPSKGYFAQGGAKFYRKALGSDYVYDSYTLDARAYNRLGPGILALSVSATDLTHGSPFYDLPQISLRGIFNTYFVDNASLVLQAEYRLRLSRRFNAAAFLGAGDNAPKFSKLALSGMRIAGGGGLRYVLNEKEKISLRLDIGISRWGIEPYFGILEAF